MLVREDGAGGDHLECVRGIRCMMRAPNVHPGGGRSALPSSHSSEDTQISGTTTSRRTIMHSVWLALVLLGDPTSLSADVCSPPMWGPRHPRRLTKAEEQDLIRERLDQLRGEMDELAARLATVEE